MASRESPSVGGLFSDEIQDYNQIFNPGMMTDGRFIFIFLVSRIEKSDLEV